jgi:site-specific recombinase
MLDAADIHRAADAAQLCSALRLALVERQRSPAWRVDVLVALSDWLDGDARPGSIPPTAPVPPTSSAARLWLLSTHLAHHPADATLVGDLVGAVLGHASALSLLTRAGLPGESRLVGELLHRLARKVLPADDDEADLTAVLRLVCAGRRWLESAPTPVVVPLMATLVEHSAAMREGLRRLRTDAEDAVAVLAVRLADLGVAADLRARAGGGPLADWPFLDLPRWCDLILERRAGEGGRREHLAGLTRCLSHCHRLLDRAMVSLEAGAVSADLVFRLDLAARQLARLERLAILLDDDIADRVPLGLQMLRDLLVAREEDTTLRGLVKRTTGLLARRIVEVAGHGGEHYIAGTPAEYRAMWRSAAGGGLLMAFVAPIKWMIGWLKLPLFFAGFVAGLNYSLAFVAMQVLHLTLATKQPSMTAATLAAAIRERGGDGFDRLVDLIARTARTQLAAVIGNIGIIVPVSLLIHLAVLGVRGEPFLGVDDARYALKSHHLLQSGSIIFASLTGVYLWFSSIAAGWVDNQVHWQHLPRALSTNRRLQRVVGTRGAARLARLVKVGAGPFAGNVVIGMLLGLTPAFGGFFGVPVEIRHITISTASVVLGTATLVGEHAVVWKDVGFAVLGLVGVATMNFTVSFALALAVALRARDVSATATAGLVRAVLLRLVRSPTSFLWPPSSAASSSSLSSSSSSLLPALQAADSSSAPPAPVEPPTEVPTTAPVTASSTPPSAST